MKPKINELVTKPFLKKVLKKEFGNFRKEIGVSFLELKGVDNSLRKDMNLMREELTQEIRNVGALVENVQHHVQFIAENFIDVKKTLDRHSLLLGETS